MGEDKEDNKINIYIPFQSGGHSDQYSGSAAFLQCGVRRGWVGRSWLGTEMV